MPLAGGTQAHDEAQPTCGYATLIRVRNDGWIEKRCGFQRVLTGEESTDEELARKTGVKTSDVRVVLNRLHSCGLFTYTRVRDRESGWYSYIWKMSEGRLRLFAGEAAQGVENAVESDGVVESESYLQKNLVGQDAPVFDASRRKR